MTYGYEDDVYGSCSCGETRPHSHVTPAADPRVETQPDGTVVPAPGWEWCYYCNGEGFVVTMDSTPNLDEHKTECGFCDDGLRPVAT